MFEIIFVVTTFIAINMSIHFITSIKNGYFAANNDDESTDIKDDLNSFLLVAAIYFIGLCATIYFSLYTGISLYAEYFI